MILDQIAVTTLSLEKKREAQNLAAQLKLDFVDGPHSETAKTYRYLLVLTPDYLGLHKTTDKKFAPFHINFLSGKMLFRIQQAGLRKELLARAIGFRPRDNPIIIDATAGLGRDSFILASLGFEVTMIERSPILYVLLQDALERAKTKAETAAAVGRLHLIYADAIDWLATLTKYQTPPHVIYLDPMFPIRQKSASVKKEMVILQDLLRNDEDSDNLFMTAITCATCRVVVKRPRLATMIAKNIAKRAPNFSMAGKSSRFDIYLI
jgi:16S rRNA (guanine1516-N2)-methyltransferase